MKNPFLPFLALVVVSSIAQAQEYPFWGLKMPPPAEPPAVHLVKEADVLVANITIAASKRNPAEQAADFARGLQVLRNAVAKNPALKIKDERMFFGGGEPSMFASSYAAGRFNTQRSGSDLKLLHPLATSKNAPEAAEVLRNLIGALKLPADVAVRIDSMQIEVNDVDSLRTAVLEAIAADAAKLKKLFNDSDVTFGGLENRVEQRPINNEQIAVFIPYTLTIGSAKKN
ncbi:MAG: hypothetical protein QM715_15335 [Nibricoccus sp.]